jgi:hypothetical protein
MRSRGRLFMTPLFCRLHHPHHGWSPILDDISVRRKKVLELFVIDREIYS